MGDVAAAGKGPGARLTNVKNIFIADLPGLRRFDSFGHPRGTFCLMKRYGMVIGLRSEKIEEYKKLHADVWPDVLKRIKACHIQNYSIYLRQLEDGQFYLFSYFEYTGANFEADMAQMAADPATQRWWSVCEPCQKPLAKRGPKDWWVEMEEVFHLG
jgi:L-rhamnose mutarotase